MKTLRPSVMRASEWWKREQRDPDEWRRVRSTVLARDDYTCVYCGVRSQRFMHINHVGPEDVHMPENLETVCKPCHSVLHMGINSMNGILSAITSDADQAEIVRETRRLVWAGQTWPEIEAAILSQFLSPGGMVYSREESIAFANKMLDAIPPGEYRGTLPVGLAVVFHEEGPWHDFPERVHRWGMRERR